MNIKERMLYFINMYFPVHNTRAEVIKTTNQQVYSNVLVCRSSCPRGLRRGSAVTRQLKLWVRIPPGTECLSLLSVVFCQVEVSASGLFLVQRSPTEGGVSEYDREGYIKRRPWLNPLNAELNPICYLLALLGAHHFLHVSRIRVKSLTLRQLMSYMCVYIYIYVCIYIYIYIYIWSTYS